MSRVPKTLLDQTAAIQALAQHEGVSMARVSTVTAPRYTLDGAGAVVQLQ